MMTKLKSRKIALVKILFLIPVLTLLLFAFTKPSLQRTASFIMNKEVISGTVTDEVSDEPLPGAAVIIAGTTTGTVTDMKGKFMLEVESMDVTLVISFVGYKTLKIPLNGRLDVEAKMVRDVIEIENTGEMSDEQKKELELKKKQEMKKKEELMKKEELKKKQEMEEGTSEGNQDNEELFYIVEDMPSFEGGGTDAFVKYVQEQVTKHKVAERTGLSGTVIMEFTVNAKGKITHIKIFESSGHDELDDTASKIVTSSPEWEPGRQRGKPVSVQYKIPVVFE